ncbi:MAG: hypothetical protein V4451_04845 [Pseudomonadota bacterium]
MRAISSHVVDVVRTVGRIGPSTVDRISSATGLSRSKVTWLLGTGERLQLVTTGRGVRPWVWTTVEGWENCLAAMAVTVPPHRKDQPPPTPAIDWRPLYGAFGIFPP